VAAHWRFHQVFAPLEGGRVAKVLGDSPREIAFWLVQEFTFGPIIVEIDSLGLTVWVVGSWLRLWLLVWFSVD
jgi:hypothetical protein